MSDYRPKHLKTGAAPTVRRTGKKKKVDFEQIEKALDRSLIHKNTVNLCVSALIVSLGVSSFLYGLKLEPSVTIFRFLTVDGTIFTTCGALVCIIVNVWEMITLEDVTSVLTYYVRLAMAVAESVIFIVVVFSHLPFFDQHLPMFDSYDSFVMHVLIPIFGVGSFLVNDSPIGRLRPMQRWHGTWFVTFYAVIILTLISTEHLPSDLIPYFFLDYRNQGFGIFAIAFVFVYGVAYLMSWGLSEWNMKFSWLWFRNIA
ncbi:MAG: hypothetical protein IKQ10_00440 [Oscillospiraceae bacterium]|nr:hypothetical protein [Oscillospiraceae bacterium]